MRKLTKIFVIYSIIMSVLVVMTWAQESVTIKASNATAHARTLYTIDFITSETLYADASVEIVFPKEFLLTKKILAGSRALNGGLVVSVTGDTVVVQRTGLGDEVPAGTKVDVMLSDIINPGKSDKDYQISVRVKREPNALFGKKVQVPVTIKSRSFSR